MCIAAWLWQSHPLYPLILLFNRDELHNRPSLPAYWWEDCPHILGGRDCVAGGTWLACSKEGRVAFLTNFLEPQLLANVKTRGDFPVRFLQNESLLQVPSISKEILSGKTPLEFALEVKSESDHYNGFNLILADLCTKQMVYVTNRPKGVPARIQEVLPGSHVLTNAALDSQWPKAQRLHKKLKDLIQQNGDKEVHEKYMVENLLSDTVKAERELLPVTGHDPEWVYTLSSIFVEAQAAKGPYGTRSMVGLSVKTTGDTTFYEKYLEEGSWKEHTVIYGIEKKQWSCPEKGC